MDDIFIGRSDFVKVGSNCLSGRPAQVSTKYVDMTHESILQYSDLRN